MSKSKAVKLKEEDGIVYFKAIRPMTEDSFKALSNMLRHEAENVGKNVFLIPFSAAKTNEKGE